MITDVDISQKQFQKEMKAYREYLAPFERRHEEAMMGLKEFPARAPQTFDEYLGHTLWINEDGSCFTRTYSSPMVMDIDIIKALKHLLDNDDLVDWDKTPSELSDAYHECVYRGYIDSYCDTETYMISTDGFEYISELRVN